MGWMTTQLLEQGILGNSVGNGEGDLFIGILDQRASYMGNSISLCQSWSHAHSVFQLPLRHCVSSEVLGGEWVKRGRKGGDTGWCTVKGGVPPTEFPVVPKWHHCRFCFYPCWAPISLSPPATGEPAFVLHSRAAAVFCSFAFGFTLHVS